MAVLQSTPQLRAALGLSEARKARHHKHCNCRAFGGRACTAADALWTQKMNVELDHLLDAAHHR